MPAGEPRPHDSLWLVVGLGNPGERYAGTRHNAGRMVVELLAQRGGERLSRHTRAHADVAQVRVGPLPGARAVLATPRSYMNESGPPVAALAAYYGVEPGSVLLVHDELDLSAGTVRVKVGGGDGGHNGLRSVRSALGTGASVRVRVGIGRPPGRQDPADFVLRPFSPTERRELAVTLEVAADAVESVVTSGPTVAQNLFNG